MTPTTTNRTTGGRLAWVVATLTFASTALAADVRLSGAGATFPQPLYEKWVVEFQKTRPTIKIDYQGIGSGGGIKAITDKTVAFAASDAPLGKKDIEAAGGDAAIVQMPMVAGGVVPVYNLPSLAKDVTLAFTGALLADMFMGKVTKWNDAKIAAANPGVKLPDLAITPAWRTDGSGTTFVFTNYLATQSDAFKTSIGMGKQVAWPVGQGGKGNPGVAAAVAQTPGAIGYVELNFATANKLAYGAVRNKAGKLVKATPASIALASESAATSMTGQSLTAKLWEQSGGDAYPIAAFTYAIVYADLKSVKSIEEAAALRDFLWWAVHDGQKLADALDYAPLPKAVVEKIEPLLNGLTYDGKPLPARK